MSRVNHWVVLQPPYLNCSLKPGTSWELPGAFGLVHDFFVETIFTSPIISSLTITVHKALVSNTRIRNFRSCSRYRWIQHPPYHLTFIQTSLTEHRYLDSETG